MKLLAFFADKVGEEMQAVVTGVEAFGLFAQGIEIPAEGLIPISNLPDDHYQFDKAGRTLTGYHSENQFRLGDLVNVRVANVDSNRRQLEFQLTGVDKARRSDQPRRGKKTDSRNKRSSSNERKQRKTRKHK